MRLIALAVLLLPACAWVPGFEEPEARAAVWALPYELSGETSMQSDAGGSVVDNPPIELSAFGVDDDTGFGARLGIGDGFSGLELDYIGVEDDTTGGGPLTADWGALLAGDIVNTSVEMYDLRLRWIAGYTLQDDAEQWGAGLGVGAVLGHRELTLQAVEATGLRSQRIEMSDDGTVYLAARGRVSWSALALTADFAYSDDLNFGGEFSGTQQDLQVTLGYRLDNQNMELFAGYWYSAFPGEGQEGNLDFVTDFSLEGYFAGLAMRF